ncbi:MAG TPA: hypothetical protein VHT51_01130 [Micropepsaceae bacterium]|nr:hypothetical protein [Micropepsaceae bacterium]
MFNFVPASKTRRIAQFLSGGALAVLLSTGSAPAQNNFLDDGNLGALTTKVSIRDLAPDTLTSWVPDRPTGDDFLPPAKGPGPVMSPKDRPYVPNGNGRQPTYRIADTSNPILKPWVKEQMEKANADVRAGKVPYITRERCWPAGVPGFTVYTRVQPIHFYQTKKEITIINELNTQIRHIYMDVPHTKNPGHTWYGESVGHYEGDELVVDTIGLNDKTYVDNYRTPHTDQIHVVERWKVIEGGNILQATVTVEDPGAFNMPWTGVQRWKRIARPLEEYLCEPSNDGYFSYDVVPLPKADKADF